MLAMRIPEIEWQPVARPEFYGWVGFYALVLLYLGRHFGQLTLLDNLHLPIHEGGHLLFSYFGQTLGLWYGTIFQLLVPALLALYFTAQNQIPVATFCVFCFFHSLTGVATYMSDALARGLPLVTVGAVADESDHDWYNIFGQLHILPMRSRLGPPLASSPGADSWGRLAGSPGAVVSSLARRP